MPKNIFKHMNRNYFLFSYPNTKAEKIEKVTDSTRILIFGVLLCYFGHFLVYAFKAVFTWSIWQSLINSSRSQLVQEILHFLLYKMCGNCGLYAATSDHGFAMSATNFCFTSLLLIARVLFVLFNILPLYDALIFFLVLLESSFNQF